MFLTSSSDKNFTQCYFILVNKNRSFDAIYSAELVSISSKVFRLVLNYLVLSSRNFRDEFLSTNSQGLYLELLDFAGSRLLTILKNYPLYLTQLTFDKEFNSCCISYMYDSQRNGKSYLSRQDFWPKISKLKSICASCWKFYLDPRNNSVKFLDIRLGKYFENEFMGFLRAKGFECIRGDIDRKNYPDIAVLHKNRQPACYLELKYLTAPFVKVYTLVKGRECYEGSTTLDTGKKIATQRQIVETEITVPVFYVYWLDYPCIKGVFFMKSNDVYAYIDAVQGTEWIRKQRSGDFVDTGQGKLKVGHLNKVYLPLLRMGNFEELLNNIQRQVEGKI